jgi:probable phosphoglycerate mutase
LEGQRFALILSSPMKRALETCELAGFGADVTVSDALCEWDYGEYEGLTTREIRSRAPEWNLWRDGCPGGESPEQIGSRADRALGELGDVDGDVLVFAHGHILRVFSARWLGCPVDFGAHLLLSAGSLCVLGLDRGTRAIVRWNAVPGTVL